MNYWFFFLGPPLLIFYYARVMWQYTIKKIIRLFWLIANADSKRDRCIEYLVYFGQWTAEFFLDPPLSIFLFHSFFNLFRIVALWIVCNSDHCECDCKVSGENCFQFVIMASLGFTVKISRVAFTKWELYWFFFYWSFSTEF